MAWSYSGNPAASEKDWIRFQLGDRLETAQSLSDEEIAYLIAEYASQGRYKPASKAAEAMAANYMATSVTQKKSGDLQLSYGYADTGKRYLALAVSLAGGENSVVQEEAAAISTDDSEGHIFSIGMGDGHDFRYESRGY